MKINKVVCAPSKDADQSGSPPRVLKVFPVRLKDE